MNLNWLKSVITCESRIILRSLDPRSMSDTHLPEICFRMDLILNDIENPRCEGRLLPRDLFDELDTMTSDLIHREGNHFESWLRLMQEFGEHYDLNNKTSIEVASKEVDSAIKSFRSFGFLVSHDATNPQSIIRITVPDRGTRTATSAQ